MNATDSVHDLELPVMSDDLWNALYINLPDACRAHHCWVDQCPAGSHDADGEA